MSGSLDGSSPSAGSGESWVGRVGGFRLRIFGALLGVLVLALGGIALGLEARVERQKRLALFSSSWSISREVVALEQAVADLHRQFSLLSQEPPGVEDALFLPKTLPRDLQDCLRRWNQLETSRTGERLDALMEETRTLIEDWQYVLETLPEDYVAGTTRLIAKAVPRAETLLGTTFPGARKILDAQLENAQESIKALGQRSDRTLILALCIPLLVFSLVSLMIVRRVLSSLTRLREGMQAFAAGDLGYRVDIGGEDEFTETARQINAMADRQRRDREAVVELNTTLEQRVQERTAELESSQSRLSDAQQLAQVGHWELNQDHGTLAGSQEFYRILEIERETTESEGLAPFLARVHPEDRDWVNEAWKRASESRPTKGLTHRLTMPDGRIKHVEARWLPSRESSGNGSKLYGTLQDVSDKVKAREALREKDLINRLVIDTALDAVVIIDENGLVIDWNRQAELLFGWSRHEILGETLANTIIPERYRSAHRRGMDTFLTTGEGPALNQRLELSAINREGTEFPIELAISPLETEGRFIFSAFVRDLTKRKQDEAERERLQSQLNQAQKMEAVGRLAGGVAHDFNNMLSVILGYTDMAVAKVEDGGAPQEELKEIRGAADRASGVTRQLLAFARKQTVSPKKLDVNQTVESMLGMLRRVIGENIELDWRPSAKTGWVSMDPSQVDQILANLCINARDAIDGSGKISIETGAVVFDEAEASQRSDIQAGDYITITVSDTGSGMDRETLEVIFEPFYTTKGRGTGLGLATVYGIARQNEGFISVYSEVDIGSTFVVYLPRIPGSEEAKEEAEEPAGRVKRGQETILVVEDEPAILTMITSFLTSFGYEVLSAPEPEEALRVAEENGEGIDLLLTDVIMPGMNGRELAEKLASERSNLHVLFMSGYTSDFIDKHGVLETGVEFIQKPFSPKDLAKKIRTILDG